jgi:hypothetical protein
MKKINLLYKLIRDVTYPIINVPMVLLSIQRWERLAVEIQNTLKFYPIKYKGVSWMSFQNIERKV